MTTSMTKHEQAERASSRKVRAGKLQVRSREEGKGGRRIPSVNVRPTDAAARLDSAEAAALASR